MDEQNQDDIEPTTDGGTPQATDDLQSQLRAALEEAEKNLNGWKRAEADFQNYQKRKEAENKDLIEFAREVTVAKLLPSLDSLEQALKHAPNIEGNMKFDPPAGGLNSKSHLSSEVPTGTKGETISNAQNSNADNDRSFPEQYQTWLTGIGGLVKQLDKALEELGVKKIEAVGKKFDPNFHEAVREVEGQEDGMIIEEYQVGYTINGKVIRPSQVGIGKAGSTKP
jgi:molecular chaperone GrpE